MYEQTDPSCKPFEFFTTYAVVTVMSYAGYVRRVLCVMILEYAYPQIPFLIRFERFVESAGIDECLPSHNRHRGTPYDVLSQYFCFQIVCIGCFREERTLIILRIGYDI